MKLLPRVLALFLLATACSSGSGDDNGNGNGNGNDKNCVSVLSECTNGIATSCVGHFVRECAADGKSFTYNSCIASGLACKNGLCQQGGCTVPEEATCISPATVEFCVATMATVSQKNCDAGTTCLGGACVPSTCKAGNVMCGWKSLLTCKDDASGWKLEACGQDQYCDPDAPACKDIDPFCIANPGGAKCEDLNSRLLCANSGKLSAEKCPKDKVCVDGFCQEKVCGKTYVPPDKDVVTVDLSDPDVQDITLFELEETTLIDLPQKDFDVPPLEKPAKAVVTMDGGDLFDNEEIKFTNAKEARYIFKDADLLISMAKGVYLLEIHLKGIDEGIVGNFNSSEPGSIMGWIWFNDGTTEQSQTQWKYTSTAYDITIDQFDPVGGRVIGTFSGSLLSEDKTQTIELTKGSFDVPRLQ